MGGSSHSTRTRRHPSRMKRKNHAIRMTRRQGEHERLCACSETDTASEIPGTPGSLAVEVGNRAAREGEHLGECSTPSPSSGGSVTCPHESVMTRMRQFEPSDRAAW